VAKSIQIKIAVACLLVGLLNNTAQATNYFVRISGSDGNLGTSSGQAFRTITKAAIVAQAGDTVYVGAGTYTSAATVANDGTAANPIRFVADSAGSYTGDAGVVTIAIKKGFFIENDDYIEVSGFLFDGDDELLTWKDSVGGVLKNCEFRNGKKVVLVKESSLTIENCYVHDNEDDGIKIEGSSSIVNISNCVIENHTVNGILIQDASQIVIEDTTCSDNTYHGIRMVADGCTATISRCVLQRNLDGFHSNGQHKVALDNCLVANNNEEGIQIRSDNSAVTVNHCTLVGNVESGIDFEHGSGWIRNSIFAFNLDEGIEGNSGMTSDYNLLYGNAGGNYQYISPGSNDIIADPEFVGSGDYQLELTSPAVDAGTGAWPIDQHGVPRPRGGAVDIGCYEMGPPIYYVRLSGDDSNSGSSPSNAFRTISRAASSVIAGATVHVGAGTYQEGVVIAELGTFDDPIQFFADTTGAETGDAGAVIVAPQVAQEFAFSLQNSTYVTLDGFRLSGTGLPQANGLDLDTCDDVTIRNLEIDHTLHGIRGLDSTVILEDCTIHDTTTAGLWLVGIDDSDLQITNLDLTDTGTYGLYVDTGDFTFNATNIQEWNISGSGIAIAGVDSEFTFQSVTVFSGTTAGVQLHQGILNATQTTFSGSGYGLAIEDCQAALVSCVFSGNTVGLYANQNSLLSVTSSTFSGSTLWGASITPSGTPGETATFHGCTFSANAGGITLVNGTDGDLLLRGGTAIEDNSAAGLHFENCNLAINDQAGGANWSTLRNQYGVSSSQSTLALTDVSITDCTSYGLFCVDSSVSLTRCTLTGSYGVYADATNDSLTIDTSVFTSGPTPGWGVIRYGGTFEAINSTLDGYWMAFYLGSASGIDQATILNATVANTTGFGVYAHSGDAVVRNTIVTGNGGTYGLSLAGGTLAHSHNLIHGFTTSYFGVAADPTEVEKSPQFLDAANGDFHLGVASAAINAGLDVGLLVPTDFDGNARPSFNGYEIGAFEFMSATGSLRILDWQETR